MFFEQLWIDLLETGEMQFRNLQLHIFDMKILQEKFDEIYQILLKKLMELLKDIQKNEKLKIDEKI